MNSLRIWLTALTVVFLLSTLSWSAPLSEEPLLRMGVAVLTVEKGLSIDLPSAGADYCGVSTMDAAFDRLGINWIEPTFPNCLPPVPGGKADLTVIYTVHFPESLPVMEVCRELSKVEGVKYAEPWRYQKLYLNHNDPERYRQYYLNLAHANEAHDFCTGDPDVVIGIIDTGIDLDHPDLAANIWVNPGEERNGRDDDGNGFIDDFNGWDYFGNDNNPTDESGHGSHCAGLASMVTNNRIGGASLGYSCSLMAVRSGHNLTVTHGYPGIQYAVRNGADVISCSWGGPESDRWTESVIQDAWERNVVVVCAAGNESTSARSYPAAYNDVVSVAATDESDHRVWFSNYGDWVDISAPGANIFSTWYLGNYAITDGTSMSCPIVAGGVGLLRSAFHFMNNEEIVQILLDGADDINNRLGQYAGLMGSGRLNVYQSILLGSVPVMTISEMTIVTDDNENGKMDPGETVGLVVSISNHEQAVGATDVTMTLTIDDPNVVIAHPTLEFPDMDPGDQFSNTEEPFSLHISADAMPHTIFLHFTMRAQPHDIIVEKTFEAVVGQPQILIVDDDLGGDADLWLEKVVEGMGKGWVRWDAESNSAPDVEVMQGYDLIIWSTGHAPEPLDQTDRENMTAAVLAGGNILLMGNRIGDDHNNRDLLYQFFGVMHSRDSVRTLIAQGLPGERPLSEQVQMYLYNTGEEGDARVSPSTMTLMEGSGADSLLVYKLGAATVGLGGVYRIDPQNQAKTVYLGFAFESASDQITSRSAVLEMLYNWFTNGGSGIPSSPAAEPYSFSLVSVFPNPFNSTLKVEFTLPQRQIYSLDLLDLGGRSATGLGSGWGKAGANGIAFNADGLPTGTYIARLSSPGFVPQQRKVLLIK